MKSSSSIFVFSAPSGAGKTSLQKQIMQLFPKLQYSISVTTRSPRPQEQNGVHYYFKTTEEFKIMISNNLFAEYMKVHNNYYGTLIETVETNVKNKQSLIMDLDVYGKLKFDKYFPNTIGILILPPNLKELERRIRSRQQDNEETVQLRMRNAIEEMKIAKDKGTYQYTLINDDFEQTVKDLQKIIIKNSSNLKKLFVNSF